MRLLDKFFGDYRVIFPALPEGTEARAQLDEVKAPLEELVSKVKDHLEIVPAADHEDFVFFGHPPDHFGIAWLHDGKVTSLADFAEEHRLTQIEIGKLIVKLSEAYQHAAGSPRYLVEIAGKRTVVITSKGLEQEMHQIMLDTPTH